MPAKHHLHLHLRCSLFVFVSTHSCAFRAVFTKCGSDLDSMLFCQVTALGKPSCPLKWLRRPTTNPAR